MSNQIDRLFRERLEGHSVQPSPEAWRKLNAGLAEKRVKKFAIWIGMAASVALLLVSGWLILKNDVEVIPTEIALGTPQLEQREVPKNKSLEEANGIDKKEDKTPLAIESPSKSLDTKNNGTGEVETSNATPVNTTQTEENSANTTVSINQNSNQEEYLEDSKETVKDENLVAENVSTNTSKASNSSVKIIYNLEPAVKAETSDPILNQSVQEEEKNEKAFDKLMAFAKNVKSSDINLGQLREVKDNLLSFDNLKSGKNKKDSNQQP